MKEQLFFAIWQMHSTYYDRGYESVAGKVFITFSEAEDHLRSNAIHSISA